MKIEIISIGDELLIGQTINTNASFLGKELTQLGLDVRWVTTIGDHAEDLERAVTAAMSRADLVIATGGLGPTHDDITKKVISELFDKKLILNDAILAKLKTAFAARGIKMVHTNEEQAQVPEGVKIINNPVGTAPGLIFEHNGKKCVVLPGVPSEMKAMCEQSLFPMLQKKGACFLQKTLRTTGIPESTLFEKVGDIQEIERIVKVAFLPKATGVDIRLSVKSDDEKSCQQRLLRGVEIFEQRVGKYIYAYDDQPLEEVVAGLLVKTGQTIAVAESCTGGLLANKLTNISGSSSWFERGVVTYSNQAKIELLGVPQITLKSKGAVSAETAEAMATGIRKAAATDFGVSTTGIAGPTGGTGDKPVGLVYVGLASAGGVANKRFLFMKDRLSNKERTVQAALNWLKKELQSINNKKS